MSENLRAYREQIIEAQRVLAHEESIQEFCHAQKRKYERKLRTEPSPRLEQLVANFRECIEIGHNLLRYAREDLDRATQQFAEACARDAEARGRG